MSWFQCLFGTRATSETAKSAQGPSIEKYTIVELMEALEAGLDPNTTINAEKQTLLHHAAGTGNAELAEMLIARGAKVDAQALNGGTPLHTAAWAGAESVADVLLNHGANTSLQCRLKTKFGDLLLDAHGMALLKKTQGSAVHERILSRILLGNQSSGGDTKTQKGERTSQRTSELPDLSSFGEVKELLAKIFIPKVEGALRQYWLTPDELCDIAVKYADLLVVTYKEYSCGDSDNMCLVSLMDKKAPQLGSVGFFGLYKFSQESDYAKLDRLAQVAPAAYVKALPELAGMRGRNILNFNGQDGKGDAKGQNMPPAELRQRLRRRRESLKA